MRVAADQVYRHQEANERLVLSVYKKALYGR